MAVGLRIYDGSGNLILDGTRRAARVINIVGLTAGTNGSYTDARFSQGQPFVSYQRDITFNTTNGTGGIRTPVFSISGNTVSWTYPAQNGSDPTAAGIAVLGVF